MLERGGGGGGGEKRLTKTLTESLNLRTSVKTNFENPTTVKKRKRKKKT